MIAQTRNRRTTFVRTNVNLTAAQVKWLKLQGRKTLTSMSSVLRQLINEARADA